MMFTSSEPELGVAAHARAGEINKIMLTYNWKISYNWKIAIYLAAWSGIQSVGRCVSASSTASQDTSLVVDSTPDRPSRSGSWCSSVVNIVSGLIPAWVNANLDMWRSRLRALTSAWCEENIWTILRWRWLWWETSPSESRGSESLNKEGNVSSISVLIGRATDADDLFSFV